MNEVVLKTENLTKRYRRFTALDGIGIRVFKGDIYGLIGRNGAGKTTLMKVISSLTHKTEGQMTLFGLSETHLKDTQRRLGFMIESPAFFGNLTAYQNLKYYALQKGIPEERRIGEALELVGLSGCGKKKYKTFSLGMKQRLGIALALMDHPDFLILDEPINGLDPIGISELRETLRRLNEEEGITMMISSHILSELYLLASRFCFIEKGKVMKELSKEALDRECSRAVLLRTGHVREACVVLEKELKTTNYQVTGDHDIRIFDYLGQTEKVTEILVQNGIDILGIGETGITDVQYDEIRWVSSGEKPGTLLGDRRHVFSDRSEYCPHTAGEHRAGDPGEAPEAHRRRP